MSEFLLNYIAPILVVFFLTTLLAGRLLPDKALSGFANWLSSRGLFYPDNEEADQKIINFIRIAVGALLLHRIWNIAVFLPPLAPGMEEIVSLSIMAVLTFFVFIGFLTPISSLLLLLLQIKLNAPLRTYTLGVDVTAMLLLGFILYPAGKFWSVDALLLRRKTGWMIGLYNFFSYADRKTQYTISKFVTLYSYYLLCLYSVILHLNDASWIDGYAAIEIMSSTYISQHPHLFQDLFANSGIAVRLAKISMQLMVVWYFLVLPAILIGGFLRTITIGWSLAFFAFSAFVLQLSILPWLEFLLLLFWFSSNVTKILHRYFPENTLNVLYDDRCNLCDRTIRWLNRIDILKTINFLPISQHGDKAETVGVDREELTKTIYSWDTTSRHIYSGYGFYLHLSRRLPLLWPFFPLMKVLEIIKVGPLLYGIIAKRRIEWFGVCELPYAPNKRPTEYLATGGSGLFFKPALLTLSAFSLLFIAAMPHSPFQSDIDKRLLTSAHILSFTPINVFNDADRGLSYQYYTVTQITDEGEQMMPFVQSDGSRDAWHISDRVYFGNSLRWRRVKNFQPVLPPTAVDRRLFCEIIQWSEQNSQVSDANYLFDFYESERPKRDASRYRFSDPAHVGSVKIAPNECTTAAK